MPTTITVANATQFYDALKAANGGETILLKPGNYGSLVLNAQSRIDLDYPAEVKIASADPDNPAVFTGAAVKGASNLTFEDINFDYTYKAGNSLSTVIFDFFGCTNLAIRDSVFDGDVAHGSNAVSNGFGAATGLHIRYSSGVTFEGNEVFGFHRGVSMSHNSDTVVRENDVHSIRMDGLTFSAMTRLAIEDNVIHDFKGSSGSGDHSDMIQFWTTSTRTPSTDVVIRGNVLDIGQGTATHSIFMRNEQVDTGRASFNAMAYRNVTIEDNTIVNGHLHGITLGPAVGVAIRNNSVLHADGGRVDGFDSGLEVPTIRVNGSSKNVTIVQNVTAGIYGHSGQPTWVVKDNVVVQDQAPYLPNHYDDVFVESSLGGDDGKNEFVAVAGGVIDRLNAGSSETQTPGPGLHALFSVAEEDRATRVFDASHSRLDDRPIPSGATYVWSFGDGTTAQGKKVSHSYADAGSFDVTLTVRLPDGRTNVEDLSVPIESSTVVSLAPEGRFVAFDAGVEVPLSLLAKHTAAGLQLGASGVSAVVNRSHLDEVVGSDEMALAFTLKADKAGASGELFRLHGSFIAYVGQNGELVFRATQEGDSDVVLVTKGAGLSSGAERDVMINLADGQMEAWVEGALVGKVSFPGITGGSTGFGSHNLVFGNPGGKPNFAGDLKAFEISKGADDYPAAPKTVVLSPVEPEATTPPVLESATILRLDLDGFVAMNDGAAVDLGPLTKMTSQGLQLGAPGVAAGVARRHVADVVGAEEMTIGFTIDPDKPSASGELFRLHGSFVAGVTSGGELIFKVFKDDGSSVGLTTKGAKLNEAADFEKDVVINLDNGKLTVWVDGAQVGEAAMSGTVGGANGFGSHGLVFGNPWKKVNFSGDLKDFELSVNDSDHQPGDARPGVVTITMAADLDRGAGDDVVNNEADNYRFMDDADQDVLSLRDMSAFNPSALGLMI